jgi:hypothetical protein
MEIIYLNGFRRELAFIEAAVEAFKADSERISFPDSLEDGCLIALRWNPSSVLVFQVADDPRLYKECLKMETSS